MSDIDNIKAQIADLEESVRLKNLAIKLESNPEYKELILDGFMRNEVIKNASFSADPRLRPEQQAYSLSVAQAGGHLGRYLVYVIQVGTNAERELVEARQALLDAMAEGE